MRSNAEVILGIHRMKRVLAGTQPVKLELDSSAKFLALLKETRPAVVVHAAGSASVDECEINPSGAYRDNVQLAINVAKAAHQASVALIHISSDHLFSGSQSWIKENSQPGPLNVYGATKLEAEQRVRAEHPGALIVRTNFFGWAPSTLDKRLDNPRPARRPYVQPLRRCVLHPDIDRSIGSFSTRTPG
jgi:dTDP-4-dehydrorhamnose reductase